MQSHAWMQARSASLLQPADLRLFAVRSGRQIVALAPLLREEGWMRELPRLHEPSDLIWSTQQGLAELCDLLAGQALPLELERVPADSPTLHALRRAYADGGRVEVLPAEPTPVIELDACRQDVDGCFNARRRSDFRRAERRARKLGEVSYEIHNPASDLELEALMKEAYAVEARSWKEAEATSLTADARQGSFFRNFTRAALPTGMLRFAFLRIEGWPAAMQIALEWQGRFWLLKISYDSAYAQCSPGQLLMLHTLRHAVRSGLSSYEFMGVMDDWTTLWTRQTRQYVHVRALPSGIAKVRMPIRRGAFALLSGLRRLMK